MYLTAMVILGCAASLAGEQGTMSGQAVAISYTLDRSMRVSLNVYDGQGQIVRSLLNGVPRPAGPQREFWECWNVGEGFGLIIDDCCLNPCKSV